MTEIHRCPASPDDQLEKALRWKGEIQDRLIARGLATPELEDSPKAALRALLSTPDDREGQPEKVTLYYQGSYGLKATDLPGNAPYSCYVAYKDYLAVVKKLRSVKAELLAQPAPRTYEVARALSRCDAVENSVPAAPQSWQQGAALLAELQAIVDNKVYAPSIKDELRSIIARHQEGK